MKIFNVMLLNTCSRNKRRKNCEESRWRSQSTLVRPLAMSCLNRCRDLIGSGLKPHLHALKNQHGTPNFWHRADDFKVRPSQFSTCKRDYLREVVSARVNEARCQTFDVPADFLAPFFKWGLSISS